MLKTLSEKWVKDFMETDEYIDDSFLWCSMAKLAYEAGFKEGYDEGVNDTAEGF